ncbi:MAG: hypothetical protein HZB13_08450 [Acidobacteria bacterium]|nr:hypothetical protein [Acidobacteriota bacterium]
MIRLNRRAALLTFGAAALPESSFAADPWLAKEPSEWSAKDIQKVLADSPWAKSVSISLGGGDSLPSSGSGRGGRGGRGGGGGIADASSSSGMGGSPMGGGGGGGGGMAGGGGGDVAPGGGSLAPTMTFLVRWHSALPVKHAYIRARMGAEAETSPQAKAYIEKEETHYIIVVESSAPVRGPGPERGGPGGAPRQPSEEMMNRAKEAASLSWKGHEGVHPDAVQLPQPGQAVTIFRFPKTHPIELEDKEVEFAMKRGSTEIKKKFRLKDMVYKGQLAL